MQIPLSARTGSHVGHASVFPPVNDRWRKTTWHDVLTVSLKFPDHIHLGEACGLVHWLEILGRRPLVHKSRIVDLCGSQSATCAFAKGRSKSGSYVGFPLDASLAQSFV